MRDLAHRAIVTRGVGISLSYVSTGIPFTRIGDIHAFDIVFKLI